MKKIISDRFNLGLAPGRCSGGFSLVELMVVVAIIGILAAMGIPLYDKFQAKSRQSEARAQLSILFAAETGFFGINGTYATDLKNIGYGVQGQNLRYVSGFTTGTACYTTAFPSAPVETVANQRSDAAAVNTASAVWVYATMPTPPAATLTNCSPTAFTAIAYGSPRSTINIAELDQMTIDQNKRLIHLRSGL